MAQRKHTRFGEKPSSYRCTKQNCKWEGKWEGKWEEQHLRQRESGISDYFCPKCGND